MPCRDYIQDYYDDSSEKALRKRNDELAALLCKASSLIIRMRDGESLNQDDGVTIDLLKKNHVEHRTQDWKAYCSNLERDLNTVENRILKIEKLGGIAPESMVKRFDALTTEYNIAKNMHIDDYLTNYVLVK
jgi:hypothetical protein